MDNDIELVNLVKQYKCIYTRYTNDSKNKELLDATWSTIARQMKTSVTDCRRRWCVLRNRYAKERREEKTDSSKKEWQLMETLSFLQQHVKRRRTFKEVQEYLTDIAENDRPTAPKLSKLEEVVINESIANPPAESSLYSDIDIEKQELDCDPLASTSSSASTSLLETSDIKKEIETVKSVTPAIRIPPVIKIVKLAQKLTTENDAEMLFCLSLHPSLQRIPEKHRNKAKIDILLLLDKYVTAK